MAQKARLTALDRTLFHAALDERISRIDIPAQFICQLPRDLLGGGIPLAQITSITFSSESNNLMSIYIPLFIRLQ